MLYCQEAAVESWSPDFSDSGGITPVWTRVRYGRIVLCNSLEWADWQTNPVQVEICDQCGTSACASGGYVHVAVLNDVVLWTMPSGGPSGEGGVFPATAIERYGSIAFAPELWRSFQESASSVPPVQH